MSHEKNTTPAGHFGGLVAPILRHSSYHHSILRFIMPSFFLNTARRKQKRAQVQGTHIHQAQIQHLKRRPKRSEHVYMHVMQSPLEQCCYSVELCCENNGHEYCIMMNHSWRLHPCTPSLILTASPAAWQLAKSQGRTLRDMDSPPPRTHEPPTHAARPLRRT